MQIAEGFDRERLTVLPRPTVARVLADGPLSAMVVTDAGWFPSAAGHYRERRQGAPEAILILCTDGSGWFESRGTERAVGAGDVLLIPPFTAHRYGASDTDPWTIWWLHVAGTGVRALCASALDSEGLVRRRVELSRLVQLADETLRHMEQGESIEHLQAAAGCAWHLFGLLGLTSAVEGYPQPIELALAVMADRIGGTVTVAELAGEVNLSGSHFAAMFKRSTGASVMHHFHAMKMGVARELLDAGYPVGVVAQRLGFRDSFYFSRQFRRFHGMSPSTYRSERNL